MWFNWSSEKASIEAKRPLTQTHVMALHAWFAKVKVHPEPPEPKLTSSCQIIRSDVAPLVVKSKLAGAVGKLFVGQAMATSLWSISPLRKSPLSSNANISGRLAWLEWLEEPFFKNTATFVQHLQIGANIGYIWKYTMFNIFQLKNYDIWWYMMINHWIMIWEVYTCILFWTKMTKHKVQASPDFAVPARGWGLLWPVPAPIPRLLQVGWRSFGSRPPSTSGPWHNAMLRFGVARGCRVWMGSICLIKKGDRIWFNETRYWDRLEEDRRPEATTIRWALWSRYSTHMYVQVVAFCLMHSRYDMIVAHVRSCCIIHSTSMQGRKATLWGMKQKCGKISQIIK